MQTKNRITFAFVAFLIIFSIMQFTVPDIIGFDGYYHIKIADIIKQKHGILLEFFEILGIGKEIANQDAEGIEHHLNPKTIRQIRKFVTFFKANPKMVSSFNDFWEIFLNYHHYLQI